jgi:general secretion pathway protein B
MSYILEALEKAEAERALGVVPGLHAQVAASPLPAAQPGARLRLLLGLPLALVALLVLAAMLWFRQPAPVIAAASPPTLIPAPPALPVIPATPAQPAGAAPSAEAPRRPLVARPPIQGGAGKTAKTVPASEPLRLKKSAPPASALAADEQLLTLGQLPQQIQQEIPVLTVGGYIYSDNRAERSLLINNKLLREGDEVAAGLRLEKMTPHAAILDYKGYRYRIGY